MLKHLEREDNLGEIKKGKKVLVDYFATWCTPCKILSPILEEVAEADKEVTIVDVMAGIRSVPTLVYYKDGKETKRVSGVHSKEEILEIINK